VTQVGAPVQGEVLAGRYRLDAQVLGDGGNSHALWRGTDSLLNRAVAIELRVPGGEAAEEMISAAVTAGRIVHPCVVGVYDAVDEGDRAFVVREWVDGMSLRDAVREGPLDPSRAAGIARTAADALASIHLAGHSHGNLHPGTVLLGDDEITLTDLRLDPDASPQADVRAIGGLLYASLTGHWPHELAPHQVGLPDAVRVDGRLLSPRQVRAGIPGYLDALTMDLLDPSVAAPEATELAAELRRYDVADPELSAITALPAEPVPPPSKLKKGLVLAGGLLCIAAAGWAVGTGWLPPSSDDGYPKGDDGKQASPTPAVVSAPIKPIGVTILDPPRGNQDPGEINGAERVIDGNLDTEWRTSTYKQAAFGKLKPGMGIVLDLGAAKKVSTVKVEFTVPGVTAEIRVGDTAPNRDPDAYKAYTTPAPVQATSTTFRLNGSPQARYVMLYMTGNLPSSGTGGWRVGVKEITVLS
jgi:hypothetical protein